MKNECLKFKDYVRKHYSNDPLIADGTRFCSPDRTIKESHSLRPKQSKIKRGKSNFPQLDVTKFWPGLGHIRNIIVNI